MGFGRFRKKPVVIEAWQWVFEGYDDFTYPTNKIPTDGSLQFIVDGKPAMPQWMSDGFVLGRTFVEGLVDKLPIGALIYEPTLAQISIATLDSVAIALPGDWILKGTKGELYPCKPEIFGELYEPA